MTVKVLILEDNAVARGFLCRVVRESFSDVQHIAEADNLESARRQLAQADAAPLRLILIDLELPDGNGLDLLAELADCHATKIVTTLYVDDEHLFPALQRGADGYLLKEDRFEVLVEELQKIARGQPPLSPAIARRLLAHFRDTHAAAATASAPEPLTVRESEILSYLSKGFTIKEIASLMGIKWSAVNDYIKAIYRKLKLASQPVRPGHAPPGPGDTSEGADAVHGRA